MPADPARALLRHVLATIAYRAGKPLRDAPPEFATYDDGRQGRTPAQILAHMGDLFAWATAMASGSKAWSNATPLPWPQEVARFHTLLAGFDALLAGDQPLHAPLEGLLQGPLADALTHVGQLCLLRRQSGAPIKGENYFKAEVQKGRLGPDQARPAFEF